MYDFIQFTGTTVAIMGLIALAILLLTFLFVWFEERVIKKYKKKYDSVYDELVAERGFDPHTKEQDVSDR